MWAWCSGMCERWYYLDEPGKPYCPVCGHVPIAFSAEQPSRRAPGN